MMRHSDGCFPMNQAEREISCLSFISWMQLMYVYGGASHAHLPCLDKKFRVVQKLSTIFINID